MILLLVTLLAYAGVCTHDFVTWDDDHGFPMLAKIMAAPHGLFRLLTDHTEGIYQPVTALYLGLVGYFARIPTGAAPISIICPAFNPHVFHAVAVLLHVLNAYLAFVLLRRLDIKAVPAVLGALLFAVHPMQVENVAWTSACDRLVNGALSLGALILYVDHARASLDPAKNGTQWRLFAKAVFLGLVAFFAKPSAVTLPLMAFALDYWIVKRPRKLAIKDALIWQCVMLPLPLITLLFNDAKLSKFFVPLWQRPFIASDAFSFYLAKLFVPWPLGMDYGLSPGYLREHAWSYSLVLVPIGLAVLFWKTRNDALKAAIFWAVAALLPVLGFATFPFQSWSIVADRYMYLTILGPSVLFALAAGRSAQAARVCGALIALCAGLTVMQCATWTNSETLFKNALKVNPHSALSCRLLGNYYVLIGDHETATAEYERLVRLAPYVAEYRTVLGLDLLVLNRPNEAVAQLDQARKLDPTNADGYVHLANALSRVGRLDEAAGAFLMAVKYAPSDPVNYFNYGEIRLEQKQYAEAAKAFRRAIKLSAGLAIAHARLSVALEGEGRHSDAVGEAATALKLAPNDSRIKDNYARLAGPDGRKSAN